MRAFARIRAPDQSLYELVHGDIIGRLRTAALPLDDGRVSEAHAMLSLREQELRLIALRGGFAVNGRPRAEVALSAGMRVQLARDLSLIVEDVCLPESVLGLEGEDLTVQALPGVWSLVVDPKPRVVKGYVGHAAVQAWATGEGWSLRQDGGAPSTLAEGDSFLVGGRRFTAIAIPLQAAGQAATRRFGGVDAPLRLIANFETVHIHREGDVVASLSGVLAHIVSELVVLGGPVHWLVLAKLIWPREADPDVLRPRLDVNLSRLRRKLRLARVRTDLVRSDGAGQVELLLYAHDIVEDRT